MFSWLAQVNVDNWLTLAATIVAILALLHSVRTSRQKRDIEDLNKKLDKQKRDVDDLNKKLELQLKTVTIEDIRNFAEDAVAFLGPWRPDVIYCPDLRGGFIGYFIMKELGFEIPLLTGYIFPRDKPTPNCNIDNYYEELGTPKHHVLIEKYIHKFKDKNILIVDEIAVTGEAVQFIKEAIKNNSPNSSIKSCVLAVSVAAIKSGREPNFAWRTVEHHDITFPWGRWI